MANAEVLCIHDSRPIDFDGQQWRHFGTGGGSFTLCLDGFNVATPPAAGVDGMPRCPEAVGTWPFQAVDPRCERCGEPIELVVGAVVDRIVHVSESESYDDPRAGEDV